MTDSSLSTTELSREECEKLWNRFDYNGNGLLSLAELDKNVLEIWPHFNHKPAIMRAYKAADKNDDGFLRKHEFRAFLRFIHFYNSLWSQFSGLDTEGDRRLSKEEFQGACETLKIENADQVFLEMDKNGGGYVLFDEFCAYMANKET